MKSNNVEIARRWFDEVWNERRTSSIGSLAATDCVAHLEGGDINSAAAFCQLHAEFLSAFPDLKIQIDDIVADDENAVVRWTARGSHRGDAFGLKATAQPAEFRGITWMKIHHGVITEAWDSWNQAKLFQQLATSPS